MNPSLGHQETVWACYNGLADSRGQSQVSAGNGAMNTMQVLYSTVQDKGVDSVSFGGSADKEGEDDVGRLALCRGDGMGSRRKGEKRPPCP